MTPQPFPPLVDHRGRPLGTLGELTGKSRLAVFYPGLGYGPLAPLFFYIAHGLEAAGWDVLALDYRYNEDQEFASLSDAEKERWFLADALALGEQLKGLTQGRERVARVAKSLGTKMLLRQSQAGQIDSHEDLVWLTPTGTLEEIWECLATAPQRHFVAWGTRDPRYTRARATALGALRGVVSLEVPEAGHSFEIEGDTLASIQALERVVGATLEFLQEAP